MGEREKEGKERRDVSKIFLSKIIAMETIPIHI